MDVWVQGKGPSPFDCCPRQGNCWRTPIMPGRMARDAVMNPLRQLLHISRLTGLLWTVAAGVAAQVEAPPGAVPLPPGVKAVWDLEQAHREMTATRERVSLNGLWRWQPTDANPDVVPAQQWGFFKVPGGWPGITDYLQKDSQRVFVHPSWQDRNLAEITTAWYERPFTVPTGWEGRRIKLDLSYLNSMAVVFIDGKKVDSIRFPAGDLDITSFCQAGRTHTLTLWVTALPLKAVLLSYTDSASAREVKGVVQRRGLCGDVFLRSEPSGPRISDVAVSTSTRKGELQVRGQLEGLQASRSYFVQTRVLDRGQVIKPSARKQLRPVDVKRGRWESTEAWRPDRIWDLDTPQHTYVIETTLLDESGRTLDVFWESRFGFREFWVAGRDFMLNGTRLHLSAVPLDNAQVGAALASYEGAKESLRRLQSFGINFVYTHNYDCKPGAHLSFEEILRAADDVGMLVALSQPHFSHYDWRSTDAEERNGYAQHSKFYTRVAGNHPSVVMYSMSHNATGYDEDMNPDLIDGRQAPRDSWSRRNAKVALRAEAIVRDQDPSRLVYHHASGNLGIMHAVNFYPNFIPIQELSDWFEHWASAGVKPVFLCEYGAPFTWDWTMYRGWYKGQREFGSATVPWEFCLAEWNAQFFGDQTYAISEAEKANLRWEAQQFQAGKLWHRWDYPNDVGSTRLDERYPLFERYLTDNWRAFRTWGMSATSPWEFGHFWKKREGLQRRRQDLPVDWDRLQRPGLSPDFLEHHYERMDLCFEPADWIATPAAEALYRNNRPLLGYIGGKSNQFTSKDHVFQAGERVEKQFILINDSRRTVDCTGEWRFSSSPPQQGTFERSIAPGGQARIPWRLPRSADLPAGAYELKAQFRFSNGETQTDAFQFQVLNSAPPTRFAAPFALFDPKGETAAWLERSGVPFQRIEAGTDPASYPVLLIGKGALTVDGPAPDITRVRTGLKVLLFEQTSAALEKRLGFRVTEYGLRNVFPRVPDHPALASIPREGWRDWRGEATLLPPRLDYKLRLRYGPTVEWCGIPVTRAWRCGNRGNVASVLIEKPTRGDFLALLDGGYSLQYSPLLEYREGTGVMLFCQMDVTGRTEDDPVADLLRRNLLGYLLDWQPPPTRTAVYLGSKEGEQHLETSGFRPRLLATGSLAANEVLILGPGAILNARQATEVRAWLDAGGQLVSLGLESGTLSQLAPGKVGFREAEHIASFFEPPPFASIFAGIGPADVHNRAPQTWPLVSAGADILGDGCLAQARQPNIALCQILPWRFDPTRQLNFRRTFRKSSWVLARLLGNLGLRGETPLLKRFGEPVPLLNFGNRCLEGLYLDQPEEWDDPYRYFRW